MLQLRQDLSFCFIGERAVLLDLEADRYFLLSGDPLRAVRDAMAGRLAGEREIHFAALGDRPLLVPGRDAVAPVEAAMPLRSALEAPAAASGEYAVRDVFAAQCRTSVALRFRGLRGAIARWRAVRPVGLPLQDSETAVALAQFFAAKRALVPLRRSCVPDSLALLRLLWRYGADADLLFGARLDPFAAHCWVQAEGQVLSDPLSNVVDFTPVFRL
jgi:hypothetical protein